MSSWENPRSVDRLEWVKLLEKCDEIWKQPNLESEEKKLESGQNFWKEPKIIGKWPKYLESGQNIWKVTLIFWKVMEKIGKSKFGKSRKIGKCQTQKESGGKTGKWTKKGK